jgi:hypothetical protein
VIKICVCVCVCACVCVRVCVCEPVYYSILFSALRSLISLKETDVRQKETILLEVMLCIFEIHFSKFKIICITSSFVSLWLHFFTSKLNPIYICFYHTHSRNHIFLFQYASAMLTYLIVLLQMKMWEAKINRTRIWIGKKCAINIRFVNYYYYYYHYHHHHHHHDYFEHWAVSHVFCSSYRIFAVWVLLFHVVFPFHYLPVISFIDAVTHFNKWSELN